MSETILSDPGSDGFVLRSCGDSAVDEVAVEFAALVMRSRAELREAALVVAQAVADALGRRDQRYPQLILKYHGVAFERAWAVKANGHERCLSEFAADLADLLDGPAAELGAHLDTVPAGKVGVRREHEGHTQTWATKLVFTAAATA